MGRIMINRLIEQRQIESLCHFTRVDNLNGIIEGGIMPRESLDISGRSYHPNDLKRYDGCPNAVSVSIEFPNYKMFYSLRKSNMDVEWVVLRLDSSILCDFECAYCWTNAADRSVTDIPLQIRIGDDAFRDLFRDKIGYPKRNDLGIPSCYPTNPQAEVLVFDTIPVDYIQKICFQKNMDMFHYRDIIPYNIDYGVESSMFMYRLDWEWWQ